MKKFSTYLILSAILLLGFSYSANAAIYGQQLNISSSTAQSAGAFQYALGSPFATSPTSTTNFFAINIESVNTECFPQWFLKEYSSISYSNLINSIVLPTNPSYYSETSTYNNISIPSSFSGKFAMRLSTSSFVAGHGYRLEAALNSACGDSSRRIAFRGLNNVTPFFMMTDSLSQIFSTSSLIVSSTLVFPYANNSSTAIADWNGNWVTRIQSSLALTTLYQKIDYSLISSSNPNEPSTNFQTYHDFSSVIPETTSSFVWAFPKTYPLSFFTVPENDTTYGWLITYTLATDVGFTDIRSYEQKSVYIRYYGITPTSSVDGALEAGVFTSTSTYAAVSADIQNRFGSTLFGCAINNPSSTFDLWNPADWKCVIVDVLNDVASSSINKVTVGYSYVWDKMKLLFPLNILAGVNGAILQAAHPTSTQDYSITFVIPHTTRTVTILNNSTTAWIVEQTGFDYKHWIDVGIYFLALLLMIETVVIIVKKMHETPT